jgi:hypothetical protein
LSIKLLRAAALLNADVAESVFEIVLDDHQSLLVERRVLLEYGRDALSREVHVGLGETEQGFW